MIVSKTFIIIAIIVFVMLWLIIALWLQDLECEQRKLRRQVERLKNKGINVTVTSEGTEISQDCLMEDLR